MSARLLRLGWAVALGALLPAAAAAQGAADREDLVGRLRYFYDQRAYPFARIPASAFQTARAVYASRWPAAPLAQRTPVALSVAGWVPIGPTTIADVSRSSGRVTSLAVVPSQPNTIYAAAADGGVWKTINGGATWTPLTDGECSLGMGALAVDPVSPNIVYAGTGEMNFNYDLDYGCGVLRSTDGGATWTALGGSVFTPASGAAISKIVVDRASAGSPSGTTVLAASSVGLYRSTNSGQTWTAVLGGQVTDLLQDPAAAATLYAAVGSIFGSSANGVFKSSDGGVSWSRLTGFPSANVGRIQLAQSLSSPATLLAAVQDTRGDLGSLLGIYKSVNAGTTWTKLAASGVGCYQCWYDLVIAVKPTDPNVVYFGGSDLYRSTDGGGSFSDITGSIHVDQHAFAFDPGNAAVILAGTDGGVYRSANQGGSWVSLNTNLAITQFSPGASVSEGPSDDVLGGTQDNGTLEYTGNPMWSQVFDADGGFTALNYPTLTAYLECQWNCGPYRRDGGGGFASKANGINANDRASFLPPLVIDPVTPSVLYFGTYRLYRTANKGDSWTTISPDLAGGGSAAITAIAVAPSHPQTIYVGTDNGKVQVTTNGGTAWTDVTAGLPNRYVTDLAVDAANDQHAYVTVSGYGTSHVLKTVNGGATWQDINANLVDVPVNAILRVTATGELYLGTDLGVFRSTNDGASWAPWTTGLPNVRVQDLVYRAATGTIVAATHGRSMFAYTVTGGGVLRGDVNVDGRVATVDAQGVLTGIVSLGLPSGWILNPNGDANCDGVVNALDAQIVLSYAVGLATPQFCVGGVK